MSARRDGLRDEVVDLGAVLHGEAGDRGRPGGIAGLGAARLGEPVGDLQRDDDVLVDDDGGRSVVGRVLVDPEAEPFVEGSRFR
jgi:hypothetical protein